MTAHHTDSHWPLLPNSWTAGPFISSLSKELMRLMYSIFFFFFLLGGYSTLAAGMPAQSQGCWGLIDAGSQFPFQSSVRGGWQRKRLKETGT